MCPARLGGFDIIRIFSLARRRWPGLLVLLVLVMAGCSVTKPQSTADHSANPPASLFPEPLLQTSPNGTARTLAVMPADASSDGAVAPVIVRGTSPPAGSAAAPAGAASPADVTLNFAGADIRDVVASVLGGTLKLNYVIDPDVAGPVNFNVSRPLRRDEVLSTLEAVLESRGFTMVQSDGIVRVMASRSDGKPRAAAPFGAPAAAGQRTEVFPVRYVAVADIARVLEKILPPGQAIVADETRHVLLVAGTSDELKLAEDTVRIFDVDQLSGTSVALLPLQNAEAATVVIELQNIFGATRKEADSNVIRFLPMERLNAVMVLTRQPRYLDEAREWVQRLDRTRDANERRVYVYYLQYGKAGQVAQTLQGALADIDVEVKGGETAPTTGLGAAPADTSFMSSSVPPPAVGFPTPPPLVPVPPPVSAPAAVATPPSATRPSVRIEADEARNALLIAATPRDYGLIRQVLEGIDTPPMQVLIEVTVAEVTLNDNLRYGVQYFLNSRGGASNNVSTLLTTGTSATGIAPPVPGFSLALTAANMQPRIVLDALSDLTQTKVISTPRLMVLDNQTARLQVGDVVPIITQSAASTLSQSPLVLSNVQYKETGVVLEVTPRVNAGGNVTMEINQSVSDVAPTTSSTINSPTFTQRRLTSTVSVKTGNTILLGGLIQNQDNREAAGIPVLQDIPVLGVLFGSRNDTAARTELIMFMTPYVLSNDTEASDITDRLKRQFQSVLDRSTMAAPRPPSR